MDLNIRLRTVAGTVSVLYWIAKGSLTNANQKGEIVQHAVSPGFFTRPSLEIATHSEIIDIMSADRCGNENGVFLQGVAKDRTGNQQDLCEKTSASSGSTKMFCGILGVPQFRSSSEPLPTNLLAEPTAINDPFQASADMNRGRGKGTDADCVGCFLLCPSICQHGGFRPIFFRLAAFVTPGIRGFAWHDPVPSCLVHRSRD